jgi:hypothetical protein
VDVVLKAWRRQAVLTESPGLLSMLRGLIAPAQRRLKLSEIASHEYLAPEREAGRPGLVSMHEWEGTPVEVASWPTTPELSGASLAAAEAAHAAVDAADRADAAADEKAAAADDGGDSDDYPD